MSVAEHFQEFCTREETEQDFNKAAAPFADVGSVAGRVIEEKLSAAGVKGLSKMLTLKGALAGWENEVDTIVESVPFAVRNLDHLLHDDENDY